MKDYVDTLSISTETGDQNTKKKNRNTNEGKVGKGSY